MVKEKSLKYNKYFCKRCKDRNYIIQCGCGCGKTLTKYHPKHYQTRKCISGHQNIGKPRYDMKGEKHFRWKGFTMHNAGYRVLFKPDHPFSDKYGRIYEHRLIMEKHIGRYLDPKEVVHHKNGIRDDNRIENLELYESHSKHILEHTNERKRDLKGLFR